MKWLVILLCFVLVLSGYTKVKGGECMTGSGTIGDPYIITTRADLEAVNDHLDAYYELGADISLVGGDDWWPIGWSDPYTFMGMYGFTGHFDGKDHTISGMHIAIDVDVVHDGEYMWWTGLFCYLFDATIQNLKMQGCSIVITNGGTYNYEVSYVGLLAGRADATSGSGASTISHVTVCGGSITCDGVYSDEVGLILGGTEYHADIHACQASGSLINSGEGSYAFGGIVGGLHFNGHLDECRADLAVINTASDFSDIGGIVGTSQGPSNTFTDCIATLTLGSAAAYEVGAFVGYTSSANAFTRCVALGSINVGSYGGGFGARISEATFTDCFALVEVAVAGQYSGGFVAKAASSSLTNCYSAGAVSGGSSMGGLVGAQSSSSASSCYWDTQTSGQASSALGTGKTTSEMQTQSTFSGWNFTTVWNILSGVYPFLRIASVTITDRCAQAVRSFPWWKFFGMCKVP